MLEGGHEVPRVALVVDGVAVGELLALALEGQHEVCDELRFLFTDEQTFKGK